MVTCYSLVIFKKSDGCISMKNMIEVPEFVLYVVSVLGGWGFADIISTIF